MEHDHGHDVTLPRSHWEAYIEAQVESGRYASASDVMRESLRLREAREAKLEKLRAQLKEGYDQAKRGEFVENFSFADTIKRALDRR